MTDLTRPGGSLAAPMPRRVLAYARFEAAAALKHGEQLLVSLVLPALVLIGLTTTPLASSMVDGEEALIDLVTPGVLGLAVLSSSFTSLAIATGFDRRWGVLRALGTSPLGRGGLIAGKALATGGVQLVQLLVLASIAGALGWRPGLGALAAVPFLVLGSLTFSSLGLLLGGTLRAEAVLAIANLAWVLMLVAGALVLPASALPEVWQHVVVWLPTGALGDGLRLALAGGGIDARALLVLAAWGAALGAVTSRLFRWS